MGRRFGVCPVKWCVGPHFQTVVEIKINVRRVEAKQDRVSCKCYRDNSEGWIRAWRSVGDQRMNVRSWVFLRNRKAISDLAKSEKQGVENHS